MLCRGARRKDMGLTNHTLARPGPDSERRRAAPRSSVRLLVWDRNNKKTRPPPPVGGGSRAGRQHLHAQAGEEEAIGVDPLAVLVEPRLRRVAVDRAREALREGLD